MRRGRRDVIGGEAAVRDVTGDGADGRDVTGDGADIRDIGDGADGLDRVCPEPSRSDDPWGAEDGQGHSADI